MTEFIDHTERTIQYIEYIAGGPEAMTLLLEGIDNALFAFHFCNIASMTKSHRKAAISIWSILMNVQLNTEGTIQ